MEIKTHKEMLVKYIGEVGTPERERMGGKRAEVSKIESGRSITYSTIMRAFKALGAETATLDLGRLGRVALW